MIIHVTNWAARRLHRGRKWTIMAKPRNWEMGRGSVPVLTPWLEMVELFKSGGLSLEALREAFLAELAEEDVSPGVLAAETYEGPRVKVAHGDTLLCCCALRSASLGRCHRVWAAERLRQAGWDVVLDGKPFKGVDEEWRPL